MHEAEQILQKNIQVVVFRLQDEEFGIDINCVREILRMVDITHIPDAPGFLEGVINLRGHIIAVINLNKQFGLAPLSIETSKTARIIVIEIDNILIGMMVDEVFHVLSIAEKEIEETPPILKTKVHFDYIQGIAKIGDRLIVMLDLSKVLATHALDSLAKIGGKQDG